MALNLSELIESTAQPVDFPTTNKSPTSKLELRNYEEKEPIDPELIVEQLLEATGGWPKRIGNTLFVQYEKNVIDKILNKDGLFAWLHKYFVVDWSDRKGRITKAEFMKLLEVTVESYESLEFYPHWPRLPNTYYAFSPSFFSMEGESLDELINNFNPATHADRELIKAFLLTLFWGGPKGQRPAFLITANEDDDEQGRGVGKSTFVSLCSELCGGTLDVSEQESIENIKKRVHSQSSGETLPRIVLKDNIKTMRLSAAGLESLITAPIISGHEMYKGNASRPNYLIYALTINGAYLSKDMAQRCIEIRLERPSHSTNWLEDVREFIEENRSEIIGDIIDCLREDGIELDENNTSRWGAWEKGVLSRVSDPEGVRAVIRERQHLVDDDSSQGEEFVEYLRERQQHLNCGHITEDGIATVRHQAMQSALGEYLKDSVSLNMVKKRITQMGIPKSVLWQQVTNGRERMWFLRLEDEDANQS